MPSPPYQVGKAVETGPLLLEDFAKLLDDFGLLDDDLTTLEEDLTTLDELRFTEELDFGIAVDEELTGAVIQTGSP